MSSPEGTGTFVEACSACSLTSALNDDTVCGCTCPNGTPAVVGGTGATLCDTNTQLDCSACNTGYALSLAAAAGTASTCLPVCLPTQVLNSDKAATGSVSGVIDTSMIVTCNEGWTGSGATVCDSDKVWNPVRTCTANSCAATQVANSDKSVANSITGTYIITIFSIFFASPLTLFYSSFLVHLTYSNEHILFFFSCPSYFIQVQRVKRLLSLVTLGIPEVVLLPVVQTVNLIH